MKTKAYTGVGSRRIPKNIMVMMKKIATKMNKQGFKLRSGGAEGSDYAFELGAGANKSIYLAKHANEKARAISRKYHPAWNKCSQYAKDLHGRNAFQILGRDLDTPSRILYCWTPDGCYKHRGRTIETGGTGTAISIADHYGVKVINLKRTEHFKMITEWLKIKN